MLEEMSLSLDMINMILEHIEPSFLPWIDINKLNPSVVIRFHKDKESYLRTIPIMKVEYNSMEGWPSFTWENT